MKISEVIPEGIKYDKAGKYWIAALDKYQQDTISEDELLIELHKYELPSLGDNLFVYAECDNGFYDPENIIGVIKEVKESPLVCRLYGCESGHICTENLYENLNIKRYNHKPIQAYAEKVEQIFNLTEDEIMEIYQNYNLEEFQKLPVDLRESHIYEYSQSELRYIMKNDSSNDVREAARLEIFSRERNMIRDVENSRAYGPENYLYLWTSDPNSKLSKWYDAEMEKREAYKQKDVDMDR